jgi:hypothetical protein
MSAGTTDTTGSTNPAIPSETIVTTLTAGAPARVVDPDLQLTHLDALES